MSIGEHIQRAVDHFGSQALLAERIGLSQQGVSYLLHANRISAEIAIAIDRATGGAVSKEQLRPDLFTISSGQSGAQPLEAQG